MSPIVLDQFIDGFTGLYYNGELVMDATALEEAELMIPDTIFGEATGEQYLVLMLYRGEDLHPVHIKVNVA